MKISGSGILALAAIAGGFLLWQKRAAISAALNPASDKNVAYSLSNEIIRAISGNKVDTVGTAIANVFPSAAEKAVAAMLKVPSAPMQTTIATNPFDTKGGAGSATSEPLTTESYPIFGLGENGRWIE